MRKGITHGPDIDRIVTYLHGRIERDIEQACLSTGLPLSLISARVSELLHPGGQWPQDQVPLLRRDTPRLSAPVAEVEVAQHPRHHASSPDSPAPLQGHRGATVSKPESKRGSKQADYWAKMTPQERSREMARRQRKWSATAKAKWSGTKSPPSRTERLAKQRLYQARSVARKQGLPLPELPSEKAGAVV